MHTNLYGHWPCRSRAISTRTSVVCSSLTRKKAEISKAGFFSWVADICPTAVSFFNTNADKVQHDPHLERRQRALVRGVANLTHDDSGRLASVTMHVGRGRLGAHFMGGPITDHGRWCVMGLH